MRADAGLAFAAGAWERDRPPDPPLARTTHPTVFLGAHRALVFGGETRDSHLSPMVNTNDTWIYRTDERRFEEVRSELAPAPRCHQPAAYSPDHDVVLYSGGWRNDDRYVPTEDARDVPAGQILRGHVALRLRARAVAPLEVRAAGRAATPRSSTTRRRGASSSTRSATCGRSTPRPRSGAERPRPRVVGPRGEPAEVPRGASTQGGYDPATGLIVMFGAEHAQPDGAVLYGNPTMVYDVRRERAHRPRAERRAGAARALRPRLQPAAGRVRGVRRLCAASTTTRWADLWTYHVGEDRWTRPPGVERAERARRVLRDGVRPGARRVRAAVRSPRVDALPERGLAPAPRPPLRRRARRTCSTEPGFAGLDRVHIDWSGTEGASCEAALAVSPDAVEWSALEAARTRRRTRAARAFVKVSLVGRGADLEVRALGFAAGDEPPLRDTRRIELRLPPLGAGGAR